MKPLNGTFAIFLLLIAAGFTAHFHDFTPSAIYFTGAVIIAVFDK